MEYRDYYQTLGVAKDASEKEIKHAFRNLARECHPDVNPDDVRAEERFKEINEAYEALSDPDKRAKYDQLGSAWREWDRTGGRSGNFDWSQWAAGAPGGQRFRYTTTDDLGDLFGGGNPFSDFFGQILSGVGGRAGASPGGFQYRVRPQRGQDYEQKVEISLREAYQGTVRALQKDDRQLEGKIPPGVRTGTRIRVAGEGRPGAAGGAAGDLYLRVNVLSDPQFERRGDALYVTVPVDLYTAVLGGQAQAPTLSGPVRLTIPAGTQNGRTFRLKGRGMPRLKQSDQYGDLYVKVDVRLPTQLAARQRELFKELQCTSREEANE